MSTIDKLTAAIVACEQAEESLGALQECFAPGTTRISERIREKRDYFRRTISFLRDELHYEEKNRLAKLKTEQEAS